MTNNTKAKLEQFNTWEKEFFDNFVAVKVYDRNDQSSIYRKVFADEVNLPFKVLEFIRNLLLEQRQQIVIDFSKYLKEGLAENTFVDQVNQETGEVATPEMIHNALSLIHDCFPVLIDGFLKNYLEEDK